MHFTLGKCSTHIANPHIHTQLHSLPTPLQLITHKRNLYPNHWLFMFEIKLQASTVIHDAHFTRAGTTTSDPSSAKHTRQTIQRNQTRNSVLRKVEFWRGPNKLYTYPDTGNRSEDTDDTRIPSPWRIRCSITCFPWWLCNTPTESHFKGLGLWRKVLFTLGLLDEVPLGCGANVGHGRNSIIPQVAHKLRLSLVIKYFWRGKIDVYIWLEGGLDEKINHLDLYLNYINLNQWEFLEWMI